MDEQVDLAKLDSLGEEASRGYRMVEYKYALRKAAPALLAEVRQLRERNRLLEQGVANLAGRLTEIAVSCPCGARPETPHTHPHVLSCPVEQGLLIAAAMVEVKDA